MTASTVRYRVVTSSDSPALEALVAACPDAGTIGFTYDYQADLLSLSKTLAINLHGVVAVLNGQVIAMAFGEQCQVQWAGELHEGMYLSNLRVHPDYRRRGVADGLTRWGMAYVEENVGPDAILYAAIQEGNASLPLLNRYQFRATNLIQGAIVPMRRTPPQAQPGLVVRPAGETDLLAIAEGINSFYREHNLWSPVTAASLQEFLEQEVAGIRPNQLHIVKRGGDIVGGLSLSDRTGLVRMRIAHAPGYARVLGSLLGLLPKDGVLRALTVRRVWYKKGGLDAGRYLWQQLRYQLRDRGNCLGVAYDPRDRLGALFQVPFWMPLVKARYVVRTPSPFDPERYTYCVAGA